MGFSKFPVTNTLVLLIKTNARRLSFSVLAENDRCQCVLFETLNAHGAAHAIFYNSSHFILTKTVLKFRCVKEHIEES